MKQNRFQARYGPWAVVTGASSGIGRALSVQLAQAKVNLVLVARSEEVLEQLAAELCAKHGVECRVVALDLSKTTGIDSLEAATHDLEVGLLVAAAGFGTSGPFLEASLDSEFEMLNVNCRALMALSWHFGNRFARRGRGGLILMSSIVGFQGTPLAAHYAATKAYVQILAEALAVELAPLNVDVLASAPGPVHSGFAQRAGMTMGKALVPEDVARGTLAALGRKTTILPGFLSKLLVYSLAPLPRPMRIKIMGRVMHDMTKHRVS